MLESEVKRHIWIICIVTLLFLLIFSENGLLSYFRLRGELKEHKKNIASLINENSALEAELRRLREDPSYLEEIARKKYGLIWEGEKVLRFEK